MTFGYAKAIGLKTFLSSEMSNTWAMLHTNHGLCNKIRSIRHDYTYFTKIQKFSDSFKSILSSEMSNTWAMLHTNHGLCNKIRSIRHDHNLFHEYFLSNSFKILPMQ